MEIKIPKEFVDICNQIIKENRTIEQWTQIESCDMFQCESFCGGFDACENEFCFSYYDKEGNEYWFQLNIEEIHSIANREVFTISNAHPADYS